MSKNLVGSVPGNILGAVKSIIEKYQAGKITDDHIKRFANMDPMPFAVLAKDAKREIEKFAAKTERRLSTIFKKRIVVDPLPPEFTDENLALWARFNFRPVFLPREDISANRPLNNWTKLGRFFTTML